MLSAGREAALTANTTPSFLAEISREGTGTLTDAGIDWIESAVSEATPAGTVSTTNAPLVGFEAFDPENARITIFTSGSTGRPKAITKRMIELETEVMELIALWGDSLRGKHLYSTVSHQHIYGLLFSVLLPYTLETPFFTEQIRYPESLETLEDQRPVLVCSPAFLRRLVQVPSRRTLFSPEAVIFSSGGLLVPEIARETEKLVGSVPWEVYGSTETGGIAYRRGALDEHWTPFRRVEVMVEEEGRIVVTSPYMTEPCFVTGDVGEMREDGRFVLGGRSDTVVKIEEKRISLTEVECRLTENPLVREAVVVAITDGRQYLAAAVVLTEEGRERFRDAPKRVINSYFRAFLSEYLENTVIPKKWRFPEALPRNAQDKVQQVEVKALFEGPSDLSSVPSSAARLPVVNATVVSQEENRALVEVTVPAESVYFDGHFPVLKILPGVAQFNIAMEWGMKLFGVSGRVRHISRVKFRAPIPPDRKFLLELRHDGEKNSVEFRFTDGNTHKMFSTGTCFME